MIKARSGNLLILGLEAMNVERLKAGNPMLIKLSELGVPNTDLRVVITYGDTQEEILAQLERDLGLKPPSIDPVNTKPI